MFNNFFFENFTIYDTTWRNFVELGRPQVAMWLKRVLDTKATNIHSDYVILFHCNSGCTNTPHCYLHYLSCFPIVSVLLKTQKSLSSCKTQDLWYPKCWFHWLDVICTHPLEIG